MGAGEAVVGLVGRPLIARQGAKRSPRRHCCACQREPLPSGPRRKRLQLLVDADSSLEHRVGVMALVADGLEHAGRQSVELALDGGLRA